MPRRTSKRVAAWLLAALCAWHVSTGAAVAQRSPYPSPTQLRWDPTNQTLIVQETGTDTICVVDPAQGAVIRRSPRPDSKLISPAGFLCPSPDGKWSALIDPWEPRLLIAHVSAAELPKTKLSDCRQIPLGPHINPQALAATPDGRTVLVACDTPGVADRSVAVVAVESGLVERRRIPGSSNLRGIAISPDGTFALVVHLRPKSHLPSTQIAQGWVFTNAVSFLSLTGPEKVVGFPLDLRTQGFANPEGIVIDPQGRWAYVAHAGADVVSVIDLPALLKCVAESPVASAPSTPPDAAADSAVHGDDLRITQRYVMARIPVGANPRGLAVSPNGKTLAVANRLSDSVSLIDTTSRQVTQTVSLTDIPPDFVRRGEILFHSGKLAFGSQFSCASCHPDGQTDGLNWDLPADGFNNFHNTKSLLATAGTQPYGWLGESPNLRERFTGTLRHLFQYEPQESDVTALEAYLVQLSYPADLAPRVTPNSDAALRGKTLFAGRAGCAACHRGSLLTDQRSHDVGTGTAGKGEAAYDTPSLLRVTETAPFLHDGRALTLEAIFKQHNPGGAHGNASDLSPEQLADLIEYLKSL